jgi:chromosomal replication initiation ATPase DnaA
MSEIVSVQSITCITPPAQTLATPAPQVLVEQLPAVPGRISVRRVVAVTAKHFHTTPTDLVSRCRKRRLVRRRQIAMYIAREKTGRSFAFIGRIMDDRDHSTIVHGVRVTRSLIDAGDRRTIAAVNRIVRQLEVTARKPSFPPTIQKGRPV